MLAKFKNIVTEYAHWSFIGIFFVGLISLSMSRIMHETNSLESFLEVFGIALMSVGLVAPISEFFQYKTLSKHSGIVRGAQDSGIAKIFISRSEDKERFFDEIDKVFEESSEFNLMGIAFPDLFRGGSKSFFDKVYSCDKKFKFLILKDKGQAAHTRAHIEKGRSTALDIRKAYEHLKSILSDRIASCMGERPPGIDNDEWIKKIREITNFEVHTYDFPPLTYVIWTDKSLFLEQYHFGRAPKNRSGDCLGGRLPIIQYDRHSLPYKIMHNHFNYVWDSESEDITDILIKEALVEHDSVGGS